MTSETALPFADALSRCSVDGAIDAVRRAGLDAYRAAGIPNHRAEAWKYTRLKSLEDSAFRPSTPADAAGSIADAPGVLEAGQCAARLVFVNGHPRSDLSSLNRLPAGVQLNSLSGMDAGWLTGHLGGAIDGDVDGLASLNTAAFSEGYVLRVGRGVALANPIEIVSLSDSGLEPLAWFPRNLIVLEENAQATVVLHETSIAAGHAFVNALSEISLAANARLKLYGVNDEDVGVSVVSKVYARLGRVASLETFVLDQGAGLTRNESTVLLEGEGAEARVDGGYLLRGDAHCDNTTRIEHRMSNTICNEVFKGVVDDRARAVFQGKIVVCKDAQHADGRMLNKTLLLSDKAEIDTKPELEIYADDVKCAHGATSGQIDETALFYLRSRGIPERAARNLLVRSFLGEATERIANEAVRAAVTARIEGWLPDGGAAIEEQAA